MYHSLQHASVDSHYLILHKHPIRSGLRACTPKPNKEFLITIYDAGPQGNLLCSRVYCLKLCPLGVYRGKTFWNLADEKFEQGGWVKSGLLVVIQICGMWVMWK